MEKIKQKIFGYYEECEYRGPAETYFKNGGAVEHALDAVLQLAKIYVDDGCFEEMLEDDCSTEFVETPFDEDYDLVLIMCLDRECFHLNY